MRRAITMASTALTSAVLALLFAGPAFAEDPLAPSEGADSGPHVSALHILLLYVALPFAIAGFIAVVVWLPGAMKANRYRPNRAWTATPVWFSGPADPLHAVESAEVGDLVRGGARGSW